MVCWTFSFCWQDIALAKNPALFRLIFARLIEVVLSEKPYNTAKKIMLLIPSYRIRQKKIMLFCCNNAPFGVQ